MTTEIIGRSRALLHALELVDRFAPTPLPILLVGATGTGKELFAHRIHEGSGRRGLLVSVNCAALPGGMVESLLFGHHRGAFTGAVETVAGYVEAAEGGTLFLDELSSLPAEAQTKLLRVLETKDVNRLGETTSHRVDFRVVAAVQEGVRAEVEAGTLRLDLYERIAGIVVELPPLTERPEDIVLLAEHFARLDGRTLDAEAVPVLLAYGWPGNVRELRVVIERARFLSASGPLTIRALVEAIALGAPGERTPRRDRPPTPTEPAGPQRDWLIAMGRDHGWNVRSAAAALGVDRATLYRWLRVAGISLRTLRAEARIRAKSRDVARGPSILPNPSDDRSRR